MKMNSILPCVFALTVCFSAHAQVVPEATSQGGLGGSDKFSYALRYSETAQFSSAYFNSQTSTLSGSASYVNGNEHLPFNLTYAGGYAWALSGTPFGAGQFHRLNLSQGIDSHRWNLVLSDSLSYLPQSPTTGFSGIPGIGEPIGGSGSNPTGPTQSILTVNTHAIDNQATAKLTYDENRPISFSASGGPGWLRFPNNDGLDTDTLSASGEVVRHFNLRNSLTGDYLFSRFTYPGYTVSFGTSTALVGYQRLWTRTVTTNISAGPVWIGSSNSSVVPTSTSVSVNASIAYKPRFANAGASYIRGVNGGAGYLIGGEFNSLTGSLSRDFTPSLNVGLSGGFDRTSGLNSNGTTDAAFGGVEATWRLGRRIVIFANYTGTNQTSTSNLPSNALNQLLHQVGFGVGYSPRESQHRR